MPEKKPKKPEVTESDKFRSSTLDGTRREYHESLHVKEPGTVYVEKSLTKNMGDYNSAKITVGVTLPVNPTDEDIAAARLGIRKAIEIVDKVIERETDLLFEG